jgi:molybdopterin synthase sulfur carrier subunit
MKVTLNVKVRYFASIRESIGQGSEVLQTTATTLGQLRGELAARGGAYAESLDAAFKGRTLRMALNQDMSDDAAVLLEGCEVAFFPPVTGG